MFSLLFCQLKLLHMMMPEAELIKLRIMYIKFSCGYKFQSPFRNKLNNYFWG